MVDSRQDVRLVLPFPPRELSPNARVHWLAKAGFVACYRKECGWIGVAWSRAENYRFARPPVEADVVFVVPDRRKRDLDNLCASLKPAWDGLTDAGVLVGDDSTVFKVANVSIEVAKKSPASSLTVSGRRGRSADASQAEYTTPCVIVTLRGGS